MVHEHDTSGAATALAHPDSADPFYYGQRMVAVHDEHGNIRWQDIPLTLDDFLDPQEGDHFMQDSQHYVDAQKGWSIFRFRYQDDPTIGVFSDLKCLWGIPGLPEPCPDVAVVPNVHDKDRKRGSFDVTAEGTRPCLVIEIVSARYREKDLADKVAIYAQAGVAEYFIIDAQWDEDDDPPANYTVRGYRLQGAAYVELQPDARGWVLSMTTGVWIGPTPDRADFQVVDAETGERIFPANERADRAEQLLSRLEERLALTEQQAAREAAARAVAEQRAMEAEQRAAQIAQGLSRFEERLARVELQATEGTAALDAAEQRATEAEQRATEAEQRATEAEQRAAGIEAMREAMARLHEQVARLQQSSE